MDSIKDFLISRLEDIQNREVFNHCISYEYLSELYYKQYCSQNCEYRYSGDITLDILLTYKLIKLNYFEIIENIFLPKFLNSLTGFAGFRMEYIIHKNYIGRYSNTDYEEILVGYFKYNQHN